MTFDLLSAEQAVERIPPGSSIVVSPACGTPTSLLSASSGRSAGRDWTLLSGLIFDPTCIVDAVARGDVSWRTWHPTSACQALLDDGLVQYVPLRASRVPAQLQRWGTPVALVRITPPDRHGWCSLGPSVGYPLAAVHSTRLTIAEIDPAMPRTWGMSMVHLSDIDLLCESTSPMPVYEGAKPDDRSRAIAGHLIGLLPEKPVLQLGIGRIPESLIYELASHGVGDVRFVGMGCDAMVQLAERDLLDMALEDGPPVSSPDLLGTSTLMDFADDNPAVGVYPSTTAHSPVHLADLERLVSVNSAIEVDLAGQVNAEMINGRRISGVGGSLDFSEAATHSPEGLRVIALPASRIVQKLGDGSAVSSPRATVDVVVTERGVARVEGMSERERAEALAAIAAEPVPGAGAAARVPTR